MGTQQICLDGPHCIGLETAYTEIFLPSYSTAAVYLYKQIRVNECVSLYNIRSLCMLCACCFASFPAPGVM